MRKWIDLLESHTSLFWEVEAAFKQITGYKIRGDDAKDYYGTDDPEELVEIIHSDIEKLFIGGNATLHRLIALSDDQLNTLKQGSSFGPLDPDKPASWTTAWQDIEPSALHMEEFLDQEGYAMYVIEAEAPFAAVDIPRTIAQNIALYWENEVTLRRGFDIKLKSIQKTWSYGETIAPVRRDLWGKTFKS